MNYNYGNINLKGGYWKQVKDLNRDVSIYSVWNRFSDTGRIKAFDFAWKPGEEQQPHVYWDSDVVKWLEGACNIIAEEPNAELSEKIDWLVERIEKNQQPDGYFNIYFTVCEPEKRFTDRNLHELYCAGHLFEAACAHYKATGSERLLNVAKKYADYIEKVFVKEQSASFTTPGHQEIELALIKLYKAKGEERYLKLSEFFLLNRGKNDKDEYIFDRAEHAQDYSPLEEFESVKGHAVRALYMLCGMADCAELTHNEKLMESCKKAYDDIVNGKMYITGGVGSTRHGEAFTVPYDLPNDSAYAETCAAISLMLFSDRMCRITHEAKYADTLERAMYNGMMSGISLDGKSYFYENPLEINLKKRESFHIKTDMVKVPITQRKEVFDCSCCPPNLNRILSSIESFFYDCADGEYYINQFAESTLENGAVKISQKTDYPRNGRVEISAEGMNALYVRIPDWCEKFTLSHKYETVNGYAKIIPDGKTIVLDMDMTPFMVYANPMVSDNAGKAAVQAGPIVYCAEGVDNGDIELIRLTKTEGAAVCYDETMRANVLKLNGKKLKKLGALYTKTAPESEDFEIKMIPYAAFANRGESDMAVWLEVYNAE